MREDWATVFGFLDPSKARRMVRAEFVRWSAREEPFQIISFHIGTVEADGDVGWTEVHYRTLLRRFPDIAARDATQWQKWRVVQGQWYPVPQRELEAYPAPPAKRDADEETRLRTRFEESWDARRRRDWRRLYELCDPRDRSAVSRESFAESESLFEYRSHRVDWVEVISGRGRVRVLYDHKIMDASLTKLPARSMYVVERWVKVDNEWYRDLKTP